MVVRSTPSGARVFIDGNDRGRTPVTLKDIEFGAHAVRLEHDGFSTAEQRVVLSASKPSPQLSVSLTRTKKPAAVMATATPTKPTAPAQATTTKTAIGSGTLGVDSRPMGATVYVDGRLVGTTPPPPDHLSAGEHAVRLERDGYQRWTSSVKIVAGEKNRVAASLENRD